MVFSTDVPYVQMQQATTTPIKSSSKINRPNTIEIVGCHDVGNSEIYDGSAVNNFVIGGAVFDALGYEYSSKTGKYNLPEKVRSDVKMYVLSPPKHGELYLTPEGKEYFVYSYRSTVGYIGKDSFTIGVDTLTKSGKPIHFGVKYNLAVMESPGQDPKKCESMKFSSAS